jgi:hypothetical protein
MWFRGRAEGKPEEFTETHYERAYGETEVKRWLQEAGFSYARSYEAYTLSPVGARAERMFFVAQTETHPLPPCLAGEGEEKG